MVAHDLVSGQRWRLWADELPGKSPFPEDALFVAYFASAEMGCFLALGWPLPAYVLDLYVECRGLKNGIAHAGSLIEAAHSFGFTLTTAEEKSAFRDRIIQGPPFSPEERTAILRYCESDVIITAELFRRVLPALLAEPKTFGQ